MTAISRHVALIPIIAKADSFTAAEMKSFRQELLQVINTAAAREGEMTAAAREGEGAAGPGAAVRGREGAGIGTGAAVGGDTAGIEEGVAIGAAISGAAANDQLECISSTSSNRGDQTTPATGSPSQHGFLSAMLMQEQLGEGDIADMAKLAKDLSLQTYFFSDESLTQLDAKHHVMPPFAVVSSSEMVPSSSSISGAGAAATAAAGGSGAGAGGVTDGTGTFEGEVEVEPGRQYYWGTCYPYDRDHSDLIILKQLLFGYWNAGIYDLLDNSYDQAVRFARRFEREEEEGMLSREERMEKIVEESCNGIIPQLQNEEQKQLHVALERAKQRVEGLEGELLEQRQQMERTMRLERDHLERELLNQQLVVEKLEKELKEMGSMLFWLLLVLGLLIGMILTGLMAS